MFRIPKITFVTFLSLQRIGIYKRRILHNFNFNIVIILLAGKSHKSKKSIRNYKWNKI